MSRFPDVHPSDIDPDTDEPYAGYCSPMLDTAFHDHEMDVDDDEMMVESDTHAGGRIADLERALRGWKCPSCGGSGIYHAGRHVAPERKVHWTRAAPEPVPCKVCGGNGLHPDATAALGAR